MYVHTVWGLSIYTSCHSPAEIHTGVLSAPLQREVTVGKNDRHLMYRIPRIVYLALIWSDTLCVAVRGEVLGLCEANAELLEKVSVRSSDTKLRTGLCPNGYC